MSNGPSQGQERRKVAYAPYLVLLPKRRNLLASSSTQAQSWKLIIHKVQQLNSTRLPMTFIRWNGPVAMEVFLHIGPDLPSGEKEVTNLSASLKN